MITDNEQDVARALDHILAVADLTITETERDYFLRAYPILRGALQHLRIPDAREAEPALIYPADNRR
jgi:hypothetical protein